MTTASTITANQLRQLGADGIEQVAAAWYKLLAETARKVAALSPADAAVAQPRQARMWNRQW